MLSLKEFYKERDVPEKERIAFPKNIVIAVPSKDFDIKPVMEALGLTRFEVNVIWPKTNALPEEEILFIRPKLVIQIGEKFSIRYPFLPEGVSPDDALKQRVHSALADRYVVLHHHDEFSLQDGLGTASQLGDLLIRQRRSFLAVTNHGSVGGWIKQYNVCKSLGLRCLFGMEGYVEQYRGDDPEEKKKHRSANHLVLLARTKEGFDNIIKIHNDAQLNGYYYSPRINWDAIRKWGKGIIGLSACQIGEIPQLLMAGKEAEAEEVCKLYMASFDKFYIELMMIEMEEQREINRRLILFARKMGVETVLSIDSHYLDSSHSETHSLLMYIRQKRTKVDSEEKETVEKKENKKSEKEDKSDVWDFGVKNLYYRNAAQIEDLFRNGFTDDKGSHPPFLDDVFTEEVFFKSMENTRLVALSIEDISLDSKIKLPKLYSDSKKILRDKVNDGMRRLGLMDKPNRQEYIDRARHEFEVITKMGFADYFLITARIVSYSKETFGEFSVGFGRGSGAGSIIAWCLGITDIDPVKYELLFERFLDETRPDCPDLDLDFDPRCRDKIKDYIISEFGVDNTCSIGTYGSYKTRAVILDIVRALGLDYHEAQELTKSLESKVSVENEEGEDEDYSIDKVDFDELIEQFADLRLYFQKHQEVLVHAKLLRNQVKHVSTHAGGVIISDLNLKDRIPVFEDKHGKIVSCWNESGSSTELSSVGLVKFDVLGLRNLCVVSDCIRLLEKTKGVRLSRKDVPIDDRNAIKMGSKKDLVGIFQFENPGVREVVDAVGMDSIEDVSAITSLIRPGPHDMGMDMEYARRKKGEPYEEVEFIKTILPSTYSIMVYQENLMKISREVAGFSMVDANRLRKACGKKIQAAMDAMKVKFIEGSKKNVKAGKLTENEVETIWIKMASFAKYGFCLAHATAYSALTCAELWLKFQYPLEFITALISNTSLGKKKFGAELFPSYINYARKQGYVVLGPDINRSQEQFTIEPQANGEGDAIRFSIGHIKNVAKASEVIICGQPWKDMADFYARAFTEGVSKKTSKAIKRKLSKDVVESLIFAGVFDSFGSRNDVIRQYYEYRKKKEDVVFQGTDKQWQEKEEEILGVCLSVKPIRWKFADEIKKNHWCTIDMLEERGRTKLFGRIVSIHACTSKKGNPQLVVTVTDDLDSFRFYVFGGGMVRFKDEYKQGDIAAIPVNKFEDGDSGTRFFDVDRDGKIIERQ